jgi:hypothetical protein
MTQRFWLGTMSGCYVGHGETYEHPQDILWWAKGGVLHGQSPQRIGWLKDFMAQAPAFHELQPLGDGKGTFVLAQEGDGLAGCSTSGRRWSGSPVHAPADLIDPWEMTVAPLAPLPLANTPFPRRSRTWSIGSRPTNPAKSCGPKRESLPL